MSNKHTFLTYNQWNGELHKGTNIDDKGLSVNEIQLGIDMYVSEYGKSQKEIQRLRNLVFELLNEDKYTDIKLNTYWKMIMRLMKRFQDLPFSEIMLKAKRRERTYIHNLQIEIAKILELDFIIVSPNRIETYKKGKSNYLWIKKQGINSPCQNYQKDKV